MVLTHGHIDHIAGVAALRKNYPHKKVSIHKLDVEMLTGAASNLSAMTGRLFRTEPADLLVVVDGCIFIAG